MSGTEATETPWVRDVLAFWFDELGEAHWFSKSDAIDAGIRHRFGLLHERIVSDAGTDVDTPRALLAAVIVVDQFSRNMFRGTPRAFAADPIGRRLARRAIERGFDASMAPAERLFLYLPFEHSEDAADQALAVRLIEPLGNDSLTAYARAHQSLIERFGRFPHRNAALGRVSTVAEADYLARAGAGF